MKGHRQHPLYWVWAGIKQRCYNAKHTSYRRYGGRGITMCERWLNSSAAFYADMGPRPPGMTIHRKDNNGPYAPWNCKWATPKEQQANRARNPRSLKFRAEAAGLPYRTVWQRIHIQDWPEELSLTWPVQYGVRPPTLPPRPVNQWGMARPRPLQPKPA